MYRRELAMKALGCVNPYDQPDRVDALLDLIELYRGGKYTYGPTYSENTCESYRDGDCWLNIPDSVLKCKGKCSSYKCKNTLHK